MLTPTIDEYGTKTYSFLNGKQIAVTPHIFPPYNDKPLKELFPSLRTYEEFSDVSDNELKFIWRVHNRSNLLWKKYQGKNHKAVIKAAYIQTYSKYLDNPAQIKELSDFQDGD